jgi:phosphatidylglycerol:prolipoprotein diacylglycerol transferase
LIPYIDIPPIKLGSIQIYAFGIMVMCAILVGNWVASKRGAQAGLQVAFVQRAVLWVIVGGFIGAHLADVFFYHPERITSDPLIFIRFNKGLSSFGGFLGAFIAILIYNRKRRVELAKLMDILSLGFIAGWPFGRIGCFLAHDHPGSSSDFFLAVAYPGGARHDLGFYELLFAILIFFVFERLRKVEYASGSIFLLLGLVYTPVRFMLDFLRADDVRYLGLTPAQIISVFFFVFCTVLFVRLRAAGKNSGAAMVSGGHGKEKRSGR